MDQNRQIATADAIFDVCLKEIMQDPEFHADPYNVTIQPNGYDELGRRGFTRDEVHTFVGAESRLDMDKVMTTKTPRQTRTTSSNPSVAGGCVPN